MVVILLTFDPVPHLQETFNVIKSMDLPEQYRLKCSKFNKYFLDTWVMWQLPWRYMDPFQQLNSAYLQWLGGI